ncbi:hypothetical protein H0Z60_19220 [Ectothiorhodospiraceae bacterium WFHF3C12]|nr:hypothetical protein [Ectothiorhodospiraceae bacterium WFHF3C12]
MKQRLAQLEGYAKTLEQAVRLMDERRQILAPLIDDDEVKGALGRKLHNTYGANAYNHLVPILGQDLVRDIVRLFLDTGKKSGSLLNLYRKASQPSLNQALRNEFISITDKWYQKGNGIGDFPEEVAETMRKEMHDNHRSEFARSFDEAWDQITNGVNKMKADPVSEKLRTFRDKYHAHLEMSRLGEDPAPFAVDNLDLTYNDLFAFSDRYMPHVFEMNRIITGTISDIDEFKGLHQTFGNAMWRILAGLDFEK